jgi:hypothetical protein
MEAFTAVVGIGDNRVRGYNFGPKDKDENLYKTIGRIVDEMRLAYDAQNVRVFEEEFKKLIERFTKQRL